MSDLIIPGEILEQIRLSPSALRVEIAVYLYERGKLSMGQARALADIDQLAFQRELAQRDVTIHYDIEDLQEDLKNLSNLRNARSQ